MSFDKGHKSVRHTKSPALTVLENWPQPHGVSDAAVFASETSLLLRYTTTGDAVAIVKFPLVNIFKFGAPNDEALGGHPLISKGLAPYRVHRVENSRWIDELEKQNSIHPRHDRQRFLKNTVHYIFTFQDSCLECVVTEGEYWPPVIQVFSSADEADDEWRAICCGPG
jgi:hypothetical protein